MDRPRVVSVVSKDAEERLPPDEAGVQVLESYVPAGAAAPSQAAGLKPQAAAQKPRFAQNVPIQSKPSEQGTASVPVQKPAGVLGSFFSKIRSLFGR